MKPSVYLAGPISGLNYKGCTGWRDYAQQSLIDVDIQAFSPLRAKSYLSKLATISATGEGYAHMSVMSNQQAVVSRDFFDCKRCDVLLVNLLDATSVSIGTMFELAWAYQQQKPIVVAIEPSGNPHEHTFVRQAIGFRLDNLESAIATVKSILL